ncbi:MAG: hypothetical protein MI808_18065 [Pseudomonadales bacterium]|nr:hypothetical protein [Pseudomonadales bacterium]
MSDSLIQKVILQRVRNRIIEVLELFSNSESFDVAVSNLEIWHDWVDIDSLERLTGPVFIKEEVAEIVNVDRTWRHVEINSLQSSDEWLGLHRASINALAVFRKRGIFSEDTEIK